MTLVGASYVAPRQCLERGGITPSTTLHPMSHHEGWQNGYLRMALRVTVVRPAYEHVGMARNVS